MVLLSGATAELMQAHHCSCPWERHTLCCFACPTGVAGKIFIALSVGKMLQNVTGSAVPCTTLSTSLLVDAADGQPVDFRWYKPGCLYQLRKSQSCCRAQADMVNNKHLAAVKRAVSEPGSNPQAQADFDPTQLHWCSTTRTTRSAGHQTSTCSVKQILQLCI